MPVLRYWDVSSGQYLPCATGPQGPAGGFGVPPQTPPASGFNSLIDAAGNVWVSLNGSSWQQARDVLHCMYYRNTALTIGTSNTTIPMDTIINDPYSIYNPNSGIFTAPIAGWWQFIINVSITPSAAGQFVSARLTVGGGATWAAQTHSGVASQALSATLPFTNKLPVNTTITTQGTASASLPCSIGVWTNFQAHYLGSG